jgi:hypothetical protein
MENTKVTINLQKTAYESPKVGYIDGDMVAYPVMAAAASQAAQTAAQAAYSSVTRAMRG